MSFPARRWACVPAVTVASALSVTSLVAPTASRIRLPVPFEVTGLSIVRLPASVRMSISPFVAFAPTCAPVTGEPVIRLVI